MSNSIVATVYSGVIRDVIDNVKKDFEDSGVDESVLRKLERIWDHKIRTAKVATWEQNGLLGDDSNQNINGASSSSTLYPASDPSLKLYDNTHASSLPSLAAPRIHSNHNNEISRHSYQIKNSNGPQAPPASSFPPSDISNRSSTVSSQADANVSPNIVSVDQKIYSHSASTIRTLQVQQENEKLVPREASSNNSPLPEFRTTYVDNVDNVENVDNVDNDDINSDLDDTEDEDANADGEETQNIILCLYDKVTRTKNKWKCQLKDGIMSVNGRDYLFQKGNGDFEF